MSNIDINTLNDFINKANEALSCGANCQKEKRTTLLKQKYLDAQTNVITAPGQLQKATQDYLTFTEGEPAYNEYRERQLQQQAQAISTAYLNTFQENVSKVNTELFTYHGLEKNVSNVADLWKRLKRENGRLENQRKTKTSDILTNDRKTYYEDQENASLQWYYTVFCVLYMILFITYIFFIFMYSSTSSLNWKQHAIVVLGLGLYPFLGTRFWSGIIYLYNQMVLFLPKNVYKTL